MIIFLFPSNQWYIKVLFLFLTSLARSRYMSWILHSSTYTQPSVGTKKSYRWCIIFFFLIKTGSCILPWTGWSVCMWKSYRIMSFFFIDKDRPRIYYLLLESLSHKCKLMVFHWSLSDSKSPQVSRTLLSILTDLNNALIWMVSTRPLISKSPCPLNNPSVPVPRAPTTICHFHVPQLFQFPSKVTVYVLFTSFNFTLWSVETANSTILQVLFFCWLL